MLFKPLTLNRSRVDARSCRYHKYDWGPIVALCQKAKERLEQHRRCERGFKHGRLHSFRHYFASTCANNVLIQMLMDWLGHRDSKMIRHYHMHDDQARRTMNGIKFLGECTEGSTPANDATNGMDSKGPSASAG